MNVTTYKYRLKGKRTYRKLRRYAWAVNQVWNFCAQTEAKVRRNYKDGLKGFWLDFFKLKDLAKGTSKILKLHAQTIQNVCAQFIDSRDRNKKIPRFRKSSGISRSLGWVPFQEPSRQISTNSLTYLGNTFKFFGAKRRPLPSNAKGGCFVEDSKGHWYACFHVEVEADKHSGTGEIGIDLGLKSFLTTSDGDSIEPPQYYRKLEEKLAVAQRANNFTLAKAINAKIKNQRQDFLHKLSTKLIGRYDTIYIGDVSSSKLAKTNLAKSVLDSGWSTFRNMLCYKASRHGAKVFIVDEKFTTRTCSACGHISAGSPKGLNGLGIRQWVCSLCGVTHNRDVNAARNILIVGRSAMPLVEESRAAYGRQPDKRDRSRYEDLCK